MGHDLWVLAIAAVGCTLLPPRPTKVHGEALPWLHDPMRSAAPVASCNRTSRHRVPLPTAMLAKRVCHHWSASRGACAEQQQHPHSGTDTLAHTDEHLHGHSTQTHTRRHARTQR